MSSELAIAERVWSRWAALVLAAGFTACVDDGVAPALGEMRLRPRLACSVSSS